MYKELIIELAQENEWVKIQPPCPENTIVDAERSVGYLSISSGTERFTA